MRSFSALSNISSNHRKTGVEAHTVVYIPDLLLDMETTLKSSGTINREIKPFGGYESVASVSISNLELGEEVSLCTEVALSRLDSGITRGCGKVISTDADEEGLAYADVRNAVTGLMSDPTMTVGQQYNFAALVYSVYRSFFQCTIPAGLTSCEEATFWLPGMGKYALTDFEIYVLEGNWTTLGGKRVISRFYSSTE